MSESKTAHNKLHETTFAIQAIVLYFILISFKAKFFLFMSTTYARNNNIYFQLFHMYSQLIDVRHPCITLLDGSADFINKTKFRV